MQNDVWPVYHETTRALLGHLWRAIPPEHSYVNFYVSPPLTLTEGAPPAPRAHSVAVDHANHRIVARAGGAVTHLHGFVPL